VVRWKNKYLVDIYRYARDGLLEKQISKKIGITQAGFIGWKKRRPSVRYALAIAAKDRKTAQGLNWAQYVEGRLPIKLQKVWNEIHKYSKEKSGYAKTRILLQNKSKRTRQELLVYALLFSGFNLTKALRTCAIDRGTFLYWTETEPDFMELLNEVQEIKKDFIEDSLLRLIKSGDSPSTIFASRTLNRDRGYGERVEYSHQHNLTVQSIPIRQLDLPVELLEKLLESVQLVESAQTPQLTGTKQQVKSVKSTQTDTVIK